jgi:hypothetical protein
LLSGIRPKAAPHNFFKYFFCGPPHRRISSKSHTFIRRLSLESGLSVHTYLHLEFSFSNCVDFEQRLFDCLNSKFNLDVLGSLRRCRVNEAIRKNVREIDPTVRDDLPRKHPPPSRILVALYLMRPRQPITQRNVTEALLWASGSATPLRR